MSRDAAPGTKVYVGNLEPDTAESLLNDEVLGAATIHPLRAPCWTSLLLDPFSPLLRPIGPACTPFMDPPPARPSRARPAPFTPPGTILKASHSLDSFPSLAAW